MLSAWGERCTLALWSCYACIVETTGSKPDATMNNSAKQFHVEGVCGDGQTISMDNAAFLFCTQKSIVESLEVGQEARVTFASGAGKSDCWVSRVS